METTKIALFKGRKIRKTIPGSLVFCGKSAGSFLSGVVKFKHTKGDTIAGCILGIICFENIYGL